MCINLQVLLFFQLDPTSAATVTEFKNTIKNGFEADFSGSQTKSKAAKTHLQPIFRLQEEKRL